MTADIILSDNNVQIQGHTEIERLTATVINLGGFSWLGRGPAILCQACDLILTRAGAEAGISNVALSHSADDKLLINRAGGYTGGVVIEGEVHIPGTLRADVITVSMGRGAIETNLAKAFQDLKDEVAQLKSEVAELRQRVVGTGPRNP